MSKLLVFAVFGLAVFSLIGQFAKYYLNYQRLHLVRFFYLDAENNLPTWYSSVALLICCVLFAIIAFVKKRDSDRYTRHWIGLAIIFFLLSMDETASFHELTNGTFRSIFNASGLLYYTWVVPAAILVVLLLFIYLRFLFALPTQTRRAFVIAGIVYVAGALGMELIGGWYTESYGANDIIYALIITVEECLEMFGVVILIQALLDYISNYLPPLKLSFE
ncbi:MAG: hypothetical protein SAJ37_10770 [Oscillatoria sp. PMC 1068.18]|nr:hypothetical protein [Oscillatoria sp. PMC 1076.18]MEC4989222.1 hypothetical protein [Oscillatoria sp. PMC 1068.18]